MPSFAPYKYGTHKPKRGWTQMQLRLWKPWRARGDFGMKNFDLGWFATREEAVEVEKEWRRGT